MPSVASMLQPKTRVVDVASGLSDEARKEVANVLQPILGATYRLLVKTQIHHWNVVGPLFRSVHLLTEEQYTDLFAAIDVIAERIRALGHPTEAPEIGTEKPKVATMSTKELLDDLIADHEALCRALRDGAVTAEEQEDMVTSDMLVARLTFHEKAIWMLRAMLAA